MFLVDVEREDPNTTINGPSSASFQGGGGVQAQRPDIRNKSGQRFFFFFFFLVLNLFYSLQMGSNGYITERKLYFSKGPEGVQQFPGGWGIQLFPGGSKC